MKEGDIVYHKLDGRKMIITHANINSKHVDVRYMLVSNDFIDYSELRMAHTKELTIEKPKEEK